MFPISNNSVSSRTRGGACFADESLRDALEGRRYIVVDGAMGSMLQAKGIKAADTVPELLCIESPELITEIHRAYVEAGAEIIVTNTFGANAHKLSDEETVRKVFAAAVSCAKNVGAKYIAADIGPLGALLEPMGELSFLDAYELFAQQARAAVAAGCDLFIIETMADLLETKAAILAIKENSDLPIIATMTFDGNGRTMMGTTPQIAALTLDALGVNALGINCSVGPDLIAGFIEQMSQYTSCALVAQPNAGLPQVVDGETVYQIDAESFIEADSKTVEAGATVLGSCCGTTPEFTRAIASMIAGKTPQAREVDKLRFATSTRQAVDLSELDFGEDVLVLNPDGEADPLDITDAIFDTEDESILRLSVDVIGLDSIAELVSEIQSMTALPLWFAGDRPENLEAAVRAYSGVPVIGNEGGAPEETFAAIARHYGCMLA